MKKKKRQLERRQLKNGRFEMQEQEAWEEAAGPVPVGAELLPKMPSPALQPDVLAQSAPLKKMPAEQQARALRYLQKEQALGGDTLTAKSAVLQEQWRAGQHKNQEELAESLAGQTDMLEYLRKPRLAPLERRAAQRKLEEFKAVNLLAYDRYDQLPEAEKSILDRWQALEYKLKDPLAQTAPVRPETVDAPTAKSPAEELYLSMYGGTGDPGAVTEEELAQYRALGQRMAAEWQGPPQQSWWNWVPTEEERQRWQQWQESPQEGEVHLKTDEELAAEMREIGLRGAQMLQQQDTPFRRLVYGQEPVGPNRRGLSPTLPDYLLPELADPSALSEKKLAEYRAFGERMVLESTPEYQAQERRLAQERTIDDYLKTDYYMTFADLERVPEIKAAYCEQYPMVEQYLQAIGARGRHTFALIPELTEEEQTIVNKLQRLEIKASAFLSAAYNVLGSFPFLPEVADKVGELFGTDPEMNFSTLLENTQTQHPWASVAGYAAGAYLWGKLGTAALGRIPAVNAVTQRVSKALGPLSISQDAMNGMLYDALTDTVPDFAQNMNAYIEQQQRLNRIQEWGMSRAEAEECLKNQGEKILTGEDILLGMSEKTLESLLNNWIQGHVEQGIKDWGQRLIPKS